MRRFLHPLLLCGLLAAGAGCQPYVVHDSERDRYLPLTGGELVLHQDLTVPPGTAHVYIQRGQAPSGRNLYATHCSLEVAEVRETPQTVRADRFRIVRAGAGMDDLMAGNRHYLAAAELGAHFGGLLAGRDDGGRLVAYVIVMALESERQPNVINLTCRSALDEPAYVDRLTLQQMQAALGAVATLRPGPSGR